MLQAIANLGGWLLMMGQHDRSESLFYYFRIEDQVPENHLVRFHRALRQFRFCAGEVACLLQRNGATVD